jgi:predicted 3-demethylubiquinone-9 3-methyltransferase (glyoxalase superfamily)
MPLNSYPWSDKYGWVQDQYGVSWQLSLGKKDLENPDVFPSLMFVGQQNGNAERAINFYTSLFKNSDIELIARYEVGDQDTTGNIKYSQFYIDGCRFAAMDSSMPHGFSFNEGISLVLSCESQEEIDFYWLNLTEGGKESQCGWCQDSFGVWWQVVPSALSNLMKDPVTGPQVTAALMKMGKIDIAGLKRGSGEI